MTNGRHTLYPILMYRYGWRKAQHKFPHKMTSTTDNSTTANTLIGFMLSVTRSVRQSVLRDRSVGYTECNHFLSAQKDHTAFAIYLAGPWIKRIIDRKPSTNCYFWIGYWFSYSWCDQTLKHRFCTSHSLRPLQTYTAF